ncbi:winged helix-turn-helix transcriptional regulator [Cryptosporangium phraense]|uniref:winged helix-turn-helix transcriptional regulator n=1 Tax=Cryptosporangium phraense TaxID=2593070 RepID=UPI0023F4926A|nr:helix-turn-helix domain-containing protein [Cryptosporangium phraense]
MDTVGGRWPLLVLAHLDGGPRRYRELEQVLTGISQRMLTLTLHRLGEDGLISRASFAEMPPRVEYSLTPLGKSLLDAAAGLVRWVSDHHSAIDRARRPGR